MINRTTVSQGPNLAADAGGAGGGQSGSGAFKGAPGNENAGSGNAPAATSTPGERSATGNQTTGENSTPPNGGLASVLRPIPEAGTQGAPGNENADGSAKGVVNAATSTPGQTAGQPKGTVEPDQSNDTLPKWTQQLPGRMRTDPRAAERLSAFKSLDEFVQAYLDQPASAAPESTTPGPDSSPEEVQAFYERLGTPAKADGYRFAKESPDFAQAAFAQHLTASQAEALYAQSLAQLKSMREGIQANLARDLQSTDAALQQEYGAKYDEALALMAKGLGNDPKTGNLSPIAQSLIDAGLAARPEIVRAFIELGRAHSEGAYAGGSAAARQADSVLNGRGFSYRDSY